VSFRLHVDCAGVWLGAEALLFEGRSQAEVKALEAELPGSKEYLSRFDCGERPEAFGFHAFRSDLPQRRDHYTMNVYVYLPRGVERPSQQELGRVEGYLFERRDAMLLGLASALGQFGSVARRARRGGRALGSHGGRGGHASAVWF